MSIEETIVETFNDSLERCQSDPHFLSLFYRKFVVSNPEVRERFANTDMAKQKSMLHGSLYMVMLAAQGNEAATVYLDRIAERHSRTQLDIRPELYDLWLETLLDTVKETDTVFNNDVEIAWREMMNYGVEYLKSRYDKEKDLSA